MIPDPPLAFWQYFDYISLAALLVVVGTLVTFQARQAKALPSTISKSVATSPRSSLVFSIVMTIFFPLYYAFLWFWVGPYILAPGIFYVLLILAFICELIFVWAPANEKTKVLHMLSASAVGLSMVILSVVVFAFGHSLSEASIGAIIVFWVVVLVTPALFMKRFRTYTFIVEVGFCAVFLAMISIIAHT